MNDKRCRGLLRHIPVVFQFLKRALHLPHIAAAVINPFAGQGHDLFPPERILLFQKDL